MFSYIILASYIAILCIYTPIKSCVECHIYMHLTIIAIIVCVAGS